MIIGNRTSRAATIGVIAAALLIAPRPTRPAAARGTASTPAESWQDQSAEDREQEAQDREQERRDREQRPAIANKRRKTVSRNASSGKESFTTKAAKRWTKTATIGPPENSASLPN
jgi:hypothetical protein